MAVLAVRGRAGQPVFHRAGPVIAVADEFPSTPGRDIRYQAVLTLGGSEQPKVPWDVYRELLDVHRHFAISVSIPGMGPIH